MKKLIFIALLLSACASSPERTEDENAMLFITNAIPVFLAF